MVLSSEQLKQYQKASLELNELLNDSTELEISRVEEQLVDNMFHVQQLTDASIAEQSGSNNSSKAENPYSQNNNDITQSFIGYLAKKEANTYKKSTPYESVQSALNIDEKLEYCDYLMDVFEKLAQQTQGDRVLTRLLKWKSQLAYSLRLFLSSEKNEVFGDMACAMNEACQHLQNQDPALAQQVLNNLQAYYGPFKKKQYEPKKLALTYKSSLSDELSKILNNMVENNQKVQQLTTLIQQYSPKALNELTKKQSRPIKQELNHYFKALEKLSQRTQLNEQLFDELIHRYQMLQSQTYQMQQKGHLNFTDFSAKKHTLIDDNNNYQLLKHLNSPSDNAPESLKPTLQHLEGLYKAVKSAHQHDSSATPAANNELTSQLNHPWDAVGVVDQIEQIPNKRLIRLKKQVAEVSLRDKDNTRSNIITLNRVFKDSLSSNTSISRYYQDIERNVMPKQRLDSGKREPGTLSNEEQVVNRPYKTNLHKAYSQIKNALIGNKNQQMDQQQDERTQITTRRSSATSARMHSTSEDDSNNDIRSNPLNESRSTDTNKRVMPWWKRLFNWIKKKLNIGQATSSTAHIFTQTHRSNESYDNDNVVNNPVRSVVANEKQARSTAYETSQDYSLDRQGNPTTERGRSLSDSTGEPEQVSPRQESRLSSILEEPDGIEFDDLDEDEEDNTMQAHNK